MWRRVTRGLVFGCLLALLSPLAHAETFVGGIDSPNDTDRVSGLVLVRGWALDIGTVSRIDLYIDDQYQYTSNINLPRPDIVQIYPDWEGIATRAPGFLIGFSTNRFPDGTHTIHAQVLTADNRTYEIGRRTIIIDNSLNQSPLASLDIPEPTGTYDANGSFPVMGWAIDLDGVQRVDVIVDGLVMQAALLGDPRPDVGNTFPDFPGAMFSGFLASIDTTRLTDGIHTLTLRATDRRGFARPFGRRTIQVFNSTNNLRPFGFLDQPLRDAVLWGTCGELDEDICDVSPCVPINPENHLTPVSGWALDLGTREDTGRVAYAELLLDGVTWYSTDDCAYNPTLGGYLNCYGLPRMDVAKFYPTYPDSPRAGFSFAMDVGTLMGLGVRPGNHRLKVRVGDQEQTFADIPNTSGIPVFFKCADTRQDFGSLGYIDRPFPADYLTGVVTFMGWAIDEDNSGVDTVEIWVDGQFMGYASYGGRRSDVASDHPTVRDSLYSGWTFSFDTRQLADAPHRLTVIVNDRGGSRTEIGSRDFTTDNIN